MLKRHVLYVEEAAWVEWQNVARRQKQTISALVRYVMAEAIHPTAMKEAPREEIGYSKARQLG